MTIKFLTRLLLLSACGAAFGQPVDKAESQEFAVENFLASLWSKVDLEKVYADTCVRLSVRDINFPAGQCILVKLNGALRVIAPRFSDSGDNAKLTLESKNLDAKRSAAFERIWDSAFKIDSDFEVGSKFDGRYLWVQVLENGKVRSHRLEIDEVIAHKPTDDPMRVLAEGLLENLEFIAPYERTSLKKE